MSPQQFRLVDSLFQHAVELPPHERAAYLDEACGGDADLRAQVEDLLGIDADTEASLGRAFQSAVDQACTAAPQSLIGTHIGPYCIVREIGQGGMGTVYQAVRADDAFVRSVAIKLISSGLDSPEALARFRVERQVLAALQHPHIATLLEGGTTEDGRPYLVMEYIEGDPLLEHCRRLNLSVPERLRLFTAVCAAVHHAHQMLVIHRDVKPGNVLVTKEGVPKLLDFGIAKLLAPEWVVDGVHATQTMVIRMTPQYASPEQMRGKPLTTASDVYSLGVLLYELLAGRPPYETAGRLFSDVERAVCETEPVRLSQAVADDPRLRRQLAGDLEMITAMALRKEPQRRYSSAQQLADDINRHLTGLPVAARGDTLLYVAGKLVRRNRLATAAFTLLAVSMVAGWASTVRESRRTQARFQEVRHLAQTLLTDIPQDLRQLPGSVPVRAKLVQTALVYLNSLSKDAANDIGLQLELAQAYDRVGDMQGGPNGPHLGQFREAIASYRLALTLTKQVANRRRDGQALHMLAWLHLKSGDLQWRLGSSEEAFGSYREALQVAKEIQEQLHDPRAYDLQREGHQRIARALTAARRLNEALVSSQAAIDAADRFAALQPGSSSSRSVAAARMIHGDALGVVGRMEESRRSYEEAVQRLEHAVPAHPDDEAAEEELADAYRRLGDLLGAPIYFHFGESERAGSYLRQALALEQEMADRHPESGRGQSRLALALRRLGSVQRATKPQESLASYARAIAISESLVRRNPEDLNYQRELANHRQPYAQALQQVGRHDAALQQMDQALAIQRRLVVELANRTVVHEDLFHSVLALGDLQLQRRRPDLALPQYEEALRMAHALVARDKQSLYAERCVAVALQGLATGHAYVAAHAPPRERAKHQVLAVQSYEDALAIWSRWQQRKIAVPYTMQRQREVVQLRERVRGPLQSGPSTNL